MYIDARKFKYPEPLTPEDKAKQDRDRHQAAESYRAWIQDHCDEMVERLWEIDDIGVVEQVGAFGRHGARMPDIEPTADGERTLAVFRRLMHHIGSEASDAEADNIWAELAAQQPYRVFGCLAEVQEALNPWSWALEDKLLGPVSITNRYAKECLALSRRFVDAGQPSVSYRGNGAFKGSADALAFQIIEKFGDRTDLDRLRKASSRSDWASYAVPAIRALDSMTETG